MNKKNTEKKKVIFWIIEAFLLLLFFSAYYLREKEEKKPEGKVEPKPATESWQQEKSILEKGKEEYEIRFYEKQVEWAGIGEGEE